MAAIPKEKVKLSIGGAISDVLDADAPGWTREAIDTTVRGAAWKTKRPSLQPDAGSVSASIQFDPEVQDTLHAMATDEALQACYVEYVDADNVQLAKASFNGFISEFKPGGDGNLEAELTIEVSGAVTLAGGAGP